MKVLGTISVLSLPFREVVMSREVRCHTVALPLLCWLCVSLFQAAQAWLLGWELLRDTRAARLPRSPGDKGRWLMAPSSAAAWALAAPPGRCALQGMPDGIPRRSGSCFGPQFQVNSLALFPFSIPVFLCKHVGKVNSHS